ncbi:hypothetical protein PmNV_041 [Penaeus monodon nudivirus]|uniref:Uncharacterized protein n=1 Tax=Penaeus monodon nudivirus TaxID=1529056 RepID=A0A076FEP4_9VIRU|nr:hypothetical protein PmNV_041 [Penaeus monodon nudivirus]AII15829.1 hypothetical protein PmNV_041 [Penaeus monodon nudivirus]
MSLVTLMTLNALNLSSDELLFLLVVSALLLEPFSDWTVGIVDVESTSLVVVTAAAGGGVFNFSAELEVDFLFLVFMVVVDIFCFFASGLMSSDGRPRFFLFVGVGVGVSSSSLSSESINSGDKYFIPFFVFLSHSIIHSHLC